MKCNFLPHYVTWRLSKGWDGGKIEGERCRGMPKGFLASAKAFTKNLAKHLGWISVRRESPREALSGLSRDSKKLLQSLFGRERDEDRDQATWLTRRGRRAYNEKHYDLAEQQFRLAIHADRTYALAYTFLGHTLYKQGRAHEALIAWGQAIEADPGSEAAAKARQKIAHLSRKKDEVRAWIEDRLED